MSYDTLIFADAHLRSRRGDEQFALSQIVDIALENDVRQILGLGDLIDRQTNRSGPVIKFYGEIARFLRDSDSGACFRFIQGQHDLDEPPWLSEVGEHVHGQSVEVGPFTAYALDFQPAERLKEALADIPEECECLLAHQVWGDWMGDITTPQADFADVPGHIRTVFTGDLHQARSDTYKNADGKDLRVWSPGATCAQKIDEPHKHYCLLVSSDGKVKRVRLKSRVFIDWDVMNTTEDLDRFAAQIDEVLADAAIKAEGYPPEMQKPLLRYTFSHKLTDAVRRVTRVVGERAYLYEKEMPPEEKAAAPAMKGPLGDAAVTPLSVLAGDDIEENDEEVKGLTRRLLEAGPAYKEEFARWWSETTGVENVVPEATDS